jgi:hypothetical protein
MKNISKNLLIMISIALGVVILGGIKSCQSPTEPDIKVQNVDAVIIVKDQAGNLLPGAMVEYAEIIEDSAITNYTNFSDGITSRTGKLRESYNVSSEGMAIRLRISTPDEETYKPNLITKDLILPCKDTTLVFTFFEQVMSSCSEPIEDQVVEPLRLCFDKKLVDTVWSARFAIACESAELDVTDFKAISGAKRILKVNDVVKTPAVTITDADYFQVGMIFDSEGREKSKQTETITVLITPQGEDEFPYTHITFTAESEDCSESDEFGCDCPDDYLFTDTTEVCLGTQKTREISLKEFINTNDECEVRLSIKKGFRTSSFKLESFNDNSFILDPMEALQKMEYSVYGHGLGVVKDSIIVGIKLRNKETEEDIDCETEIKIVTIATIIDSECSISYPGFEDGNNQLDTLTSGVCTTYSIDSETSKEVCIKNEGKCPIEITDIILTSENVAIPCFVRSEPTSYTIQPGKEVCLTVSFVPTEDHVYPDSRTGERVEIFEGELTIITNSDNCVPEPINLVGKVKIPKPQPDELTESQPSNDEYYGLFFNSNGDIVKGREDVADFAIYCENIDITGQTAEIKRGSVDGEDETYYVNFRNLGNVMNIPVENHEELCSFITDQEYFEGACEFPIDYQNDESITVEPGDILAIEYNFVGSTCNYCTFIVIRDIYEDQTTKPNQKKVIYSICSGL